MQALWKHGGAMKYLIGLFILILSQSLFAGVHTCVVNGKTVYQGKPCVGSGKTVGERERERKQASQYSTATTTPSSSSKQGGRYSEEDWGAICRSASKTASAVMRNRQLGISMNNQMDNLLPAADPAIKGVMESMIRLAYTKPRYNSTQYQQNAITDFEDEYLLMCLQSRS